MASAALLELCELWRSQGGEVELLMVPFTTLKARGIQQEFETLVPRDTWSFMHNSFLIFYTYVESVKVNSTSAIARSFEVLWSMRDRSMAERWESFQEVCSAPLNGLISIAFNETRDKTFDAPVALHSTPGEDATGELKRATTEK